MVEKGLGVFMGFPKVSKSVELFDVEGIPVSLGNVPGVPLFSAAWDEDPPRKFSPESARRNGAPVSESRFKALIARSQAGSWIPPTVPRL